MQSFDIVTIRVFLATAREGSIGAAARREHIAASAVSRRISDLERDLGVVLIQRTPSGASLTPAGRVFSKHCEGILGQFANVRADLKRFAEGEAGELRIAAVTSVMMGTLPHIVAEFRVTHPAVEVSLSEIFSSDGPRLLREDLADIAIVADTAETTGFETKPYASDPVWIIGSKDHLLFKGRKEGKPIAFNDTLDYEHMSLHIGGVLDDLVAAAARKAKRTPIRRVGVMRFDTLRKCAEAGLGLGFLRESAIRPYLGTSNLTGAPLSDEWADRKLICVYPKAHDVSPIVEHFLSLLVKSS